MVIVPHANIKGRTLAAHISKTRMACHQEGEHDGTILIMARHNWTPWQQHDFFAIKDYIDDLAAPISTSSTSTNIHHIGGGATCQGYMHYQSRVFVPRVLMPPWPPPIRPAEGHCGVADSKSLARTTVELQSRTTQM
jgi:hypothetical protein